MNDLQTGQFSLGFLLVVTTAVCIGLGLGIPAAHAARTIAFEYPAPSTLAVTASWIAAAIWIGSYLWRK